MNLNPLPLNSLVCIISARRFGDAIMNARVAQAAAQARPDIRWVVWTKADFAPLFRLMGFHQIITSEFPIAGGASKFLRESGRSLIKAIFQLRSLNLNTSIDFIGDTREAFLGSLITGRDHHSPIWERSHWMHKLIWSIKVPAVNYLPIKTTSSQMYRIAPELLSRLIGKEIALKALPARTSPPFKIAFHPFSSQAFKAWPKTYWQQLNALLDNEGIIPAVFCTTVEEREAYKIFPPELTRAKISATKSLDELIIALGSVDILVGVDSFLVHLASALGKKVVIINSGNSPTWWQPPNSIALGESGGCINYPCSNEPSCIGKADESRCIKSINPIQVLTAINAILAKDIN